MFNQYTIFLPMIAMVLLTAVVLVRMYITRVKTMKKNRIHPQKIADHASAIELLRPAAGPADNFSNLFEAPVLFYAAVLTLFVTQTTDALALYTAWVYVAFRYLHSYIHVTYNKVLHRYKIYLLSTFTLWLLWILITIRILPKTGYL